MSAAAAPGGGVALAERDSGLSAYKEERFSDSGREPREAKDWRIPSPSMVPKKRGGMRVMEGSSGLRSSE